MNQFMMEAIQQSGSDYSNKQNMLNSQYTSDMMLANRQKQVYNNAVAAAKGKMNTLIGSDYTEIATTDLTLPKRLTSSIRPHRLRSQQEGQNQQHNRATR